MLQCCETWLHALLNSYWYSYRSFWPTLFSMGGSSKCRSHLLCNLHCRLQINGSLRTYPGLHWRLKTINKPEHGFCCINVGALSILFRKLHDVLSYSATLITFCKCLTRFICIVWWFKVTKQCSFQHRPPSYISLDTIPGKCRSIQQGYSNLPLLGVVLQIYKLEVCIKLMAEPGDRGSIHFPSKAGGQLRLDSHRQNRSRPGLLM